MKIKEKSKIIMDNLDLFKSQSQELQLKVKSIARICSTKSYNFSSKQENFINQAYDYIKPLLDAKLERAKQLNDMSIADRLWEEHASEQWDEESGPYKVLSYNSFMLIYDKLHTRMVKLEKELSKERQRN